MAPGRPCNEYGDELMKYVFVHTVIDDYSWIACAGVYDDETALTAGVVLVRGCRLVRSPWSRRWVCFVW